MEISRNKTLLSSLVFGLTKNFGKSSLIYPIRSLHNSSTSKARWFPSLDKKKKNEVTLPQSAHPELGASSVFDFDESEKDGKDVEKGELDSKGRKYTEAKKKHTEHRYSTTNFHVSPRKLRFIANQIAGKPLNNAIRQMEFSPKKASNKILNSLITARDHAWRYKAMEADKCVIEQAWVGKGIYRKRPNFGARGRFSWYKVKRAHMKYIIKEKEPIKDEGIGKKRKLKSIFNYERKKVWTPVIEDKPIYNPKSFYNW